MDLATALASFSDVLTNIGDCLLDSESRVNFRSSVAFTTGKISLFLSTECEQFGMNTRIYDALIKYSKSNKSQFQSLLSSGDFYFEGRTDYKTKQLVFTTPNGTDRKGSHIPSEWLESPAAKEEPIQKRQLQRGERGPGKKDYTSNKNANQTTKIVSENIFGVIDDLLSNYNISKTKQIIEGVIARIRKNYNIHETKNRNGITADKIIDSLKDYFTGLQKYGGKFKQVESTIDTILSALYFKDCNNVEIAELLNVSRKRVAGCKVKREIFNAIVEKESDPNKMNEEIRSSDESVVDEYMADFGSVSPSSDSYSSSSDTYSESDGTESGGSEMNKSESEILGKGKKRRENIMLNAISPKIRKIREDKIDLSVVRDFCHEICRLDTFASTKVYVHNYDGTHSYHQVHIRSQSIKNYYLIFIKSQEYLNWQNENKRMKKRNSTVDYIIPTIKLRLFSNSFCPCCMDQKQRDCANHIQINYYNALKALANLRKFHGISIPMKSCNCNGHKNDNYLSSHTSSSNFMDAVLCKKKECKCLSQLVDPSKSIKEQEALNIKASADKKELGTQRGIIEKDRNIKRECAARQPKSIPLLNWGPLFSCYSKECAYQQCSECGIRKFFDQSNLCNIERNKDTEVIVRKYENIQGRSRGMQMEIVEVKMNGDEVIEHLMHCATLAIPHEWNVKWNAHTRTICVNTSSKDVLTLMTDFSAVLDHDVQDRLNTAIPCHTNQNIFLATHSPRNVVLNNGVTKRIQDNDVWHLWSAQGGILEANSYYHSVCTRHILKEYENLSLKRINIFTDGCAEQYKSRRNAYFVAALAEDTGMIVTHNYAPTASFKTMVDGQGNVTKAFYRRLEEECDILQRRRGHTVSNIVRLIQTLHLEISVGARSC